jgi:hypothetical protein
MRGRLIQRFVCVLYRLDPVATAAVVGGGYDPEFGEAKRVNNSTQLGSPSRREQAALRLTCQLDRDPEWDSDILTRGGHMKEAAILIVLFLADLETAGLVDGNGNPKIYAGDRVGAIEDLNGNLVQTFVNPPGMFVSETEQIGYGLAAFGVPRHNLFVLKCNPEIKGGRE